jgi:hypothetical protein
MLFATRDWGVLPCEQELCFRVLRFNYKVRVEALDLQLGTARDKCLRILHLKWLELGIYFRVSGL